MPEPIIEFELQGRNVLVDAYSYKDALDAFLGLLHELDVSFTQQAGKSGSSIKWLIRSTHTSNPTIELLGELKLDDLDVSDKVIRAALDYLTILENRPVRPSGLTYAGLERCQNLGAIISRDTISAAYIRALNREVVVSEHLDINIRELMGQKIEVLGSIEGELSMVTLRGRSYFNVYSDVTGKATRCYFDTSMRERIREALGHFVFVKGLIRSFTHEEGQELVYIEDLQIIKEEQLPTPEDIRGIMPNLTEGKPSERYLKERWSGKS